MAVCSFNGVSITGISATVPKNIYNNKTDNSFFSQETVFDIIEKIGVYQRRVEMKICVHQTSVSVLLII